MPLLLTDFSQPSVLWGIDGDWMTNFIPAGIKFYPTDHCGVIRVKTPDVSAKYLSLALLERGIQAKFSRTLRASTDRVRALDITLPSLREQELVVQKIEELEKKIMEAKQVLSVAQEQKNQIFIKWL